MLTVYDHLEAAAAVRQREKEKTAKQYQREQQARYQQALATCLKAKMPIAEAICLAQQIADRS